MGLLLAGAVVLALSGRSSSSGCHDDCYEPEPLELTCFLQTYNFTAGVYEGVEGVYCECGPDIAGNTDFYGAFVLIEGDYCTFYGLDDKLSYYPDLDWLYIAYEDEVSPAEDIEYMCDSGLGGFTDFGGAFEFDSLYRPPAPLKDGDICGFDFY